MRSLILSLFLCAAGVGHAQTPSPSPSATPTPSPTPDATFVPEIAREAAAEGIAAYARQDYVRARRAYKKVLDLVPNNLLTLINLGVVEFASGNMAEAESLLKRAVQIKIEAAPAWLTLGMIYIDQDKLDEALAALTQATLYDRRNARSRNYLGIVAGRKGWIDAAQSELRKAVEIDPSYRDAHYNLAAFYLESKPPAIELARRHYYRAVELGAETDPDMEKVLKSSPAP